jgi:uncharacterized protein
MVGLGTLINVGAILAGSTLGVLAGSRLPRGTNSTLTRVLGLAPIILGAMNLASLWDRDFTGLVGSFAPLPITLGALLAGSVTGSWLRIEERLAGYGEGLQRRFGQNGGSRFVEGFVDASLIFCIGPMAILGSLSDGLGRGIDLLALKSTMDGLASIAFAASLGWGVAASALSVGTYQGLLTALAVLLGSLLPAAHIASMTATGGVLLIGVGARLMQVRQVPVGNMLPALAFAPLLTALIAAVF